VEVVLDADASCSRTWATASSPVDAVVVIRDVVIGTWTFDKDLHRGQVNSCIKSN
jgi:hypothetical protein